MKPYFIMTAILAAMLGSVQAGSLYRWVDQSGNVHYGDVPTAGAAAQVEEVKISGAPAIDDANLPYETRRAREAFPVLLYVADNCSEPCQQARNLLNQRGIPFTEKNLVSQEDADSFRKMSGGENVPVLVVGKNWLKGFIVEQWNDELDIAGYPRAAPYGFRPAAPPPVAKPPLEQPVPEKAPEPVHAPETPPAANN